MERRPVTFLGIETSEVPSVVSEQLGLAKGFGLVVDYVVPESPAAAAGILQNDILKMLNDQILVEPGQLAKLVRSFAEGTSVTFTILRKGAEIKVTAKLMKRDMPVGRGMFGRGFKDWEWKLDDAIEKGLGKFGDEHERGQLIEQAVENARREVKRAGEEARRAGDEARRAFTRLRISGDDEGLKTTKIDLGKAQIVFSDSQGELKIENVEGKKILTAKDAAGRLLFSGPVDTKEEQDKVPAGVRERFDKLQVKDLPGIEPVPPTTEKKDDAGATENPEVPDAT